MRLWEWNPQSVVLSERQGELPMALEQRSRRLHHPRCAASINSDKLWVVIYTERDGHGYEFLLSGQGQGQGQSWVTIRCNGSHRRRAEVTWPSVWDASWRCSIMSHLEEDSRKPLDTLAGLGFSAGQEHLGVLLADLGEVTRTREVWMHLLRLLSPWPDSR